MNANILKIQAKALTQQSIECRKVADKCLNAAKWARDHQKTEEELERFSTFWGLERYRTVELRREARAVHLARMFLKGQSYGNVENSRRENYEPVFDKQIKGRLYDIIPTQGEGGVEHYEAINAWLGVE
jgi:hypothetical protein